MAAFGEIRVARPHAMLQIVLFAIVISELMLIAIIMACEPRLSNRDFPSRRKPSVSRAQRGYRVSGFVL